MNQFLSFIAFFLQYNSVVNDLILILVWVSKVISRIVSSFHCGRCRADIHWMSCNALCAPTILPNIRISWGPRPTSVCASLRSLQNRYPLDTLQLMFGRVPSPFSHLQASLRVKRTFDTDIIAYALFLKKKHLNGQRGREIKRNEKRN